MVKAPLPEGKREEPLMSPEEAGDSSPSSSMNTNNDTNDVKKLRRALEDANSRDATAKAALAKSDAVILELRASIRTLKRQLEKMTAEKEQGSALHAKLKQELDNLQEHSQYSLQQTQESHEQELERLKSQLAVSESQAKDSMVGELQVQLDRAHAQILTSDMVRRELEDTLEAEQYTWELRVQDQERTISNLQSECRTLREDLENCRLQWKEAEEGWTREVQELQSQLTSASKATTTTQTARSAPPSGDEETVAVLQERLDLLEKEREELQSCLDEAMQELEAVDAELRQSPSNGVEALQHLYQWLLERNDEKVKQMPTSAEKLVDAIQTHIESIPSTNLISNTDAALQVAELEAQLSVYRGDLKARDDSNAELRASLKEAVALLKPLQDAVAKSELEKQALQDQIDKLQQNGGRKDPTDEIEKRDREIQDLQRQVSSLQEEVTQLRSASPASPERTSRSFEITKDSPSSLQRAREDLKAKRNSERALQEMLRTAQSRFHALHQENSNVETENRDLRHRVDELEKEMKDLNEMKEETTRRNVESELREAAVEQLEKDIKGYKRELERKENQVVTLEEELALAKDISPRHSEKRKQMEAELEELRETAERVEELEAEVSATKGDLEAKKEAELVLTKSLKQALGLLRPLETHLETAEQEKKDLHKQLKTCKKQIAKLENGEQTRALSLPEVDAQENRNLEGALRKLEQENSKLHLALEEVSQNLDGDEKSRHQAARLKENLVELNSRYEVTQDKLERAVVENHALIDALKHKEVDERKMMDDARKLREDLMKTHRELENAKYIATSALIKVEELTMANVEQLSMLREGSDVDVSRTLLSSPERVTMQARVRTLEQEVENASQANKLLEGTLEDRERIVHLLTAGSSSSHGDPQSTDGVEPQSKDGVERAHV